MAYLGTFASMADLTARDKVEELRDKLGKFTFGLPVRTSIGILRLILQVMWNSNTTIAGLKHFGLNEVDHVQYQRSDTPDTVRVHHIH